MRRGSVSLENVSIGSRSNSSINNAAEQRFTFDFALGRKDTTATTITSAHVRLHLSEQLPHKTLRYLVQVYVALVGDDRHLCYSKSEVRLSSRWLQLDVGRCVDAWSRRGKTHRSVQLIVRAEQVDKGSLPITLRFSTGDRSKYKAMMVLFEQETGVRDRSKSQSQLSSHDVTRRSTTRSRKRTGKKNDLCRKRSLYVNFKEVGWNTWIVAPKGYNAYYCDGSCPWPLGSQFNPSTHAVVQTLIRRSGKKSIPPACCVPTELMPTSLLYFDLNGDVVFKQFYKDMVVGSCGCR